MTSTAHAHRQAFVHEAELVLPEATDPGAPGAAVTTALCGHFEHEGACRWAHNNALWSESGGSAFRTLFIATPADEEHVRQLIDRALRTNAGWSVHWTRQREVTADEQPLASRLLSGPSR